MEKQLIISIGREFGSGGHQIADLLSKEFNLPLFDKNLLHAIAEEKETDSAKLERYDEKPHFRIKSRTVRGFNNSPEAHIAQMQFDFIRNKAEQGESFVIVGRCAESVLKHHPALVSIFVLADMDEKVKRVTERIPMKPKDMESYIIKHNLKRKLYHNRHCQGKWGDSRNYDISINSSRLGIEKTGKYLIRYIRERMNMMEE